ncbi:hypothetical protein K445DRAFT_323374 [Daldinia sp. EC12]|nr:hypothetical protein K445DRAFT_323374 [Daldinia sp. EC12]
MPLGWYLAQGLYPLGPSSSDDEEGPCELPNGRIVCGPHGLVVCGKCCTDYSFMDEDEEEDEDEDVDDHFSRESSVEENILQPPFDAEERKGTGRVIPTKFIPPTDSITPTELFPGQRTYLNITR